MKRKQRRPPPELAKPQMTSLVDVLTVLVFFLLKNFSTDGDIMTPSPGLELPASSAKERPENILSVAISQKHILADGKPIALVAEESERENATIPALGEWLAKQRGQTEAISNYNASVSFEGKLSIQGDRKIPFRILHKVLNTCGAGGYSKFSLAVTEKDVR